MYTVAELIEALKQCPEDYKITIDLLIDGGLYNLESIGIDHEHREVDLIAV